jgi:hypothetical protein
MQTLSTLEFFTRLAVGLGCGALIGAERQWRARRAGLRTNALVAAGATLFVLYADISGSANSTDPPPRSPRASKDQFTCDGRHVRTWRLALGHSKTP